MSLVENIARRCHSPLELVSDIGRLAKRYDKNEIAAKLGVERSYVNTVCYLLKHGEKPLIKALERKAVSPTLALQIGRANTPRLQASLLKVCKTERRTSHEVAKIRRLFEQRRRESDKVTEKVGYITPAGLVRAYRQETDRQKLVARKADFAQVRLLFIVNALKTLLNERMFISLLREEGLEKIPLPILRRFSAASVGTR